MSNVITFPGRRPAAAPAPQPGEFVAVPEVEAAQEMVKQSAVMQLVDTLAFYAKGGFDHGNKAKAVLPAVREILAGRGIDLVLKF